MRLVRLSLILLAALAIASFFASAQDVRVGMYLLNVGKYDIGSGSFTADFYLSMQCRENCSPGNFEFMNGRASSMDKIIDTPTEKFYRIQANLAGTVDLRSFPFDSQKIQILIEDKNSTINNIRYVPARDESGVDNMVNFVGWKMDSYDATVTEHTYPIYNETYSQYAFTVNISRIFLNSAMKTFMPVLIIMLVCLFTFLMDPDKIVSRITITTSSLVAAVMFHISISNQIPPVGYLTIADKFMILTYSLLLALIVTNVLILELAEKKKPHLLEHVHRMTEYSVFIVVPLIYVIFFIIVLA